MVFHKILAAALVVAPLALAPMDGAAQQRGPDRAETARSEASAGAQTQQAVPTGLKKAFQGRTPPAALQRIFPNLFGPPAAEAMPEPEPIPEPEPAPEPECTYSMELVNGTYEMVENCG